MPEKDFVMIIIRAFRAIDEPATCERYVERHTEALKPYDITTLSSAQPEWVDDPDVFVVVAVKG